MFIQDQSNKILFNMLYYKIKKMDNRIGIFDEQEDYIGVLAEYEDPFVTQSILNEIIYLMKCSSLNKSFCVYEFPSERDMEKAIKDNKVK